MKRIYIIILIAFITNSMLIAQNGNYGVHSYGSPEDIEVVEIIEVTEVIDSLEYIDYSLYGIIKDRDWDRLVLDREQAIDILDNLQLNVYGINEKPLVKKLLTARNLKFSTQELLSYKKVRSIQVGSLGIFSYPYFPCRFKYKNGKLFFEKIAGSQRKSGYVYENKPDSKVFLSGWSVNDDPQTSYDSENSEAGMIYKISANKIIMLFLSPDEQSFEIYELIK